MLRVLLLAICAIAVSSCAGRQYHVEEDLGKFFGAYEGTFVMKEVHANQYVRHNPVRAAERFSPCSTFKIPNSMIALEEGAVSGVDDTIKWDGVVREREATNRDHTLATAFKNSVVWYYQECARRVGEERMRHWLAELEYGNQDMGAGLTEFWLGSSLKISADEQVEFLHRLHRKRLPFAKKTQLAVLEMMIAEEGPGFVLRGKTGSHRGGAGAPDLGWYVGSVVRGEKLYLFAVNISGRGAFGFQARDIALAILRDHGVLPMPEKAKRQP